MNECVPSEPLGWLVVVSDGSRVCHPLFEKQLIQLEKRTTATGARNISSVPYASFRHQMASRPGRPKRAEHWLALHASESPQAILFYGYRLKFFLTEVEAQAFVFTVPDDRGLESDGSSSPP